MKDSVFEMGKGQGKLFMCIKTTVDISVVTAWSLWMWIPNLNQSIIVVWNIEIFWLGQRLAWVYVSPGSNWSFLDKYIDHAERTTPSFPRNNPTRYPYYSSSLQVYNFLQLLVHTLNGPRDLQEGALIRPRPEGFHKRESHGRERTHETLRGVRASL